MVDGWVDEWEDGWAHGWSKNRFKEYQSKIIRTETTLHWPGQASSNVRVSDYRSSNQS